MSDFHEYAAVYDPDPEAACPDCKKPCIFASDFKTMGERRVRVCVPCRAVFVNGKKERELAVYSQGPDA